MRPANQSPASSLPSGSPEGQHLPLAVLRQYVAGTLPTAEQHRVEAHTLACSRCADVLEGLSQTDLATTDQALTDLQVRLRARVAEKTPGATPVVPLWPWRQMVAAVLLLLVGAGVWLGVRRTTEGPAAVSQIAQRQPAARPKAEPSADLAASAMQAPDNAMDKAVAAAPIKTESAVASEQERKPAVGRIQRQRVLSSAERVDDSPTVPAAVAAAPSAVAGGGYVPTDAATARDAQQLARSTDTTASSVKQETTIGWAAAKTAKAKKAAPAAARARMAMAASPAASTMTGQITSAVAAPAGQRVVRGQVTDQSTGTGLAGVTVLAKGTTIGVSTAADGSFALIVPDSVKVLTFQSIGYGTSEQALNITDSTLALALAPDTKQLNEVVVVRRERPPAPMSIGALPAGGFSAFQAYLKQKLEYPEKALKDGKQGSVRLRFVVAVDGTLQDIKVVRSLSEECDAEAIRLLQEGPKWYPAVSKGRRTARTVEVSVPFRLDE